MKTSQINVLFATTVLLVNATAQSTLPSIEMPFPQKGLILEAARIPDPEARDSRMREVLYDLLVAKDDAMTRSLTMDFFRVFSMWYDLKPYEDIFRRVLETYGDRSFIGVLDIQDLQWMDPGQRNALLKKALEDGEAKLPRGTGVARRSAFAWIALFGINDLRDLAVAEYAKLSDVQRTSYPVEAFTTKLDITSGRHSTMQWRKPLQLPPVVSSPWDLAHSALAWTMTTCSDPW